LEKLVKQADVNHFLHQVERIFPNFVAGILCDRHGFPIASKIPQNFPIQENILALSAISNKRDLIRDINYLKVKRDIDESKDIRLYLLLEDKKKYFHRFKKLKRLIEKQNLF
jgi:hypothetical protein